MRYRSAVVGVRLAMGALGVLKTEEESDLVMGTGIEMNFASGSSPKVHPYTQTHTDARTHKTRSD